MALASTNSAMHETILVHGAVGGGDSASKLSAGSK